MRLHEKPRRHGPERPEMPLLVSVPEAARLLGVGKTFGWAMVRSGEMPTVRLGKRVLVPRAALEQLAGMHLTESMGVHTIDDTG